MRRPPAVPSDMLVDARACAQAGNAIERHFSVADLPRLRDAGVRAGSAVDVRFQFSQFDGEPVIDGRLRGTVVLTCQRCMKALPVVLEEHFQVAIVCEVIAQEERADEPGGYEPTIADPSRLDLRWLAEDQALLALPLVPMHEPEECTELGASPAGSDEEQNGDDASRQKPFQNLRDMLRRG